MSQTAGNQQRWDTLIPDRSWVVWRSRELPVVLSRPFDSLGLHCTAVYRPVN